MEQSIDLKTLVIIMGLAQTLITIGGVFGLLKLRVNEHHKTLYGNGRPGIVTEINDIKGDVRSILENCEKTHSEESHRIEVNAQRAAEVVASATLKAAHEVAEEAVRAALRRDNTARETARDLVESHAHDTI